MSAWSEARAGLHAGIIAASQTLMHGLIAFASLGAAGVAFGMSAGLAASALAGLAMAMFGASRPLIGSTSVGPALLTAGLLAAVQPAGLGHAILLAMLLASSAGLLMLALAGTGWARLTALVPSPVTQGLGNAIALLVVVSQLPLLLGAGPGAAVPWQTPLPGALMVAALALLLMLRPLPGLPAPLLALGAATVLHLLLSQFGVATGPVVGAMPDLETLAAGLDEARAAAGTSLQLERLLLVALSLALLATIETMAVSAMLREASGLRCDQNRDLKGAAISMLGGAVSGGMPTSGASVPSLTCWRAGGRGPAAQIWRAAVAVAVLLAGGALIAILPFAALSGVFCGAVARLIQLPPSPFSGGPGRARRLGDGLIVLSVMAAALAFGLVAAVGVGVLFAVSIFTASMAVTPVRRASRNPVGRSRIRRASAQERALRHAGEQIALIELEGPIFFGSAERVLQRAEAEVADGATVLILDLARVTRIDLSGGRRLIEVWRLLPGRVLLTPLHPGSRAAAELAALGLAGQIPKGCAFADLPMAVEAAEALILAEIVAELPDPPHTPRSALEALGIPPSAIGPILALCTEQRFAAGSMILRQGDAADAAYVLLSGEVLISLSVCPARPATRLAVLAPGVVFGESALLGQTRRSADATARSDVHCLRLEVTAAERLRIEAPAVGWHLMTIVARQLSTHVSAANAVIDRLEA
ncbi:MAG: SLC26A/SulP transporter family protein [Roseomonas sp.]|nr:SLC26A/SulP transporter family protein [Roseomonas sp.]MCA3585895.1 SLC26A/SulP transporter family protein [Methylocystis sp.]MCA3332327.1 SLC26A/SulP transporter family protein [Roseomonas sp.]MCA3334352.1 SLC26A/SulP transporter family protein [Roseomonas sp.]MCA3348780.1 SLC26A/SulP transporter family protein [Roseomonas sp.]